jgi:hypothetical protein
MRSRLGLALRNSLISPPVTPARADKFLCELVNVPDFDQSPDGPNARQGVGGTVHIEVPARVREAWQRVDTLFPDLLPTRGNPIHERPHRGIWEAPYNDPQIEKLNPRTDAPGLVWQDPSDPEYVITSDIPPKLRHAWHMPTDTSRRMYLMCELAYYLRADAMCEVATKAHEAQVQERLRAEREGATAEQAWCASSDRWSEILRAEASDPAKMWTISDPDVFAQVLLRAIDVVPLMRKCPNPICPAPYFIAARRSRRYCSDACSLPAQRESKRAWWNQHGHSYRGRGKKQTIGYHSK